MRKTAFKRNIKLKDFWTTEEFYNENSTQVLDSTSNFSGCFVVTNSISTVFKMASAINRTTSDEAHHSNKLKQML